MRIEMFAKSRDVPEALRTYAELRVWRAVGCASDRLTWVAVRLSHEEDHAVDSSVVCQLDGWLRGIGLVTVRHANVDTYVAIDRAAARLEQTVLRKLREAESNEMSPSTRRGSESWDPRGRDGEEELYAGLTSE
ncbi:MAG: HPF/RaiA family ribosome-associated protein [Tepidisphaeraceae bacterium]